MKAVEPHDDDADNYQKETEKNKDAAEVRHTAYLLDGGEQSRCFAKKLCWLTWFGEDP
jgi:hypothetical protein